MCPRCKGFIYFRSSLFQGQVIDDWVCVNCGEIWPVLPVEETLQIILEGEAK
jgi:hypothetical protein